MLKEERNEGWVKGGGGAERVCWHAACGFVGGLAES